MKIINSSDKCVGCFSCVYTCPVKAITLKADKEGFLYPLVDENKCVNCLKCQKACPLNAKDESKGYESEIKKQAFVVQNKDQTVREKSSSGGAFSLIADYVLNKNGVVFGAKFEEGEIIHCKAENKDELKVLRGSKYCQSKTDYSQVKSCLEKGRIVLFAGTPCQVAGLYSFLGKFYENLYTMDFVCHGVGSPKVFKLYCDFMEKKYKSKIAELSFRDKKYGYASSSMSVTFANGKKKISSKWIKSYKKLYFSGMISRPSCYDCKFKTTNFLADFRVYDCWHVNVYDKTMDDDKGTSYIVFNDRVSGMVKDVLADSLNKEIDFLQALETDGKMMTESDNANENREVFFDKLDELGYKKCVNKFVKYTFKDFMGNYIKPFIYKTGLIKWIKR